MNSKPSNPFITEPSTPYSNSAISSGSISSNPFRPLVTKPEMPPILLGAIAVYFANGLGMLPVTPYDVLIFKSSNTASCPVRYEAASLGYIWLFSVSPSVLLRSERTPAARYIFSPTAISPCTNQPRSCCLRLVCSAEVAADWSIFVWVTTIPLAMIIELL